VAEEIVEFDRRSKTYPAGLGLAKLVGNMVTEGQRLEAARPLMQEFAARFGVTVTLWRRMGADRIVLVSSETSPADLRIDMAAASACQC
jgi:DNA-binding IclR family transcriptional regulator